ncbi:MAG: alternative ribosome rescue aminoacyl-tRNA hydrolase ArfB [Gammaproteobacteria bacterium]
MFINDDLNIDETLIEERFIRSSGPGGQHVNKVASAVQIRFSIDRCTELDAGQRERLKTLAGSRVNRHGELVITANQHRSQPRNREDARDRLGRLIHRCLQAPRVRKPKRKPSLAKKRQRVNDKRRRGDTKRMRRAPPRD